MGLILTDTLHFLQQAVAIANRCYTNAGIGLPEG
jgi:hypothetical protein